MFVMKPLVMSVKVGIVRMPGYDLCRSHACDDGEHEERNQKVTKSHELNLHCEGSVTERRLLAVALEQEKMSD